MDNDELKPSGTDCDLCNTELLTICQNDYYGYYWCKYCGTIYRGDDVSEAWYLRMCDIADKVDW